MSDDLLDDLDVSGDVSGDVGDDWLEDWDVDGLRVYGSPAWTQSQVVNNVGPLSTPPGPTTSSPVNNTIGVGTATTSAPGNNTIGVGTATTSAPGNNTIGVGTTRALRQLAGRPPTPPGQGYAGGRPIVGYKTPRRPTTGGKQPRRLTVGGKQPRRVPRQNTPSPSHSSSSSSSSSAPSSVRPGPSRGRTGMNQAHLQRQLEQILQDQQQTAAGRRIAGITTTNTITTTYKKRLTPHGDTQFHQCTELTTSMRRRRRRTIKGGQLERLLSTLKPLGIRALKGAVYGGVSAGANNAIRKVLKRRKKRKR